MLPSTHKSRWVAATDIPDDIILPDAGQCVVKVLKNMKKKGKCVVFTASGHIHKLPLSKQYLEFLQKIKPGNYVLIQPTQNNNKKYEIIRKLDKATIRQYVHDDVWPKEFDPNKTKFRSKKKYDWRKERLRRFKGLHVGHKYDYGYDHDCLDSAESRSSDEVPEGECERVAPPPFIPKIKCFPWYPPQRVKNLKEKETEISYLKDVQAGIIKRETEEQEKMRLKHEKEMAKLKKKLEKKYKKEELEMQKRRAKRKAEEALLSDDSSTSEESTKADISILPWEMLVSKKYRNEEITQKDIERFVQKQIIEEQKKKEKKEWMKQKLKEFSGELSTSSSEEEETTTGTDKSSSDQDSGSAERAKKEKAKQKAKEKKIKEKEKKAIDAEKVPKECSYNAPKTPKEALDD